MMERLTTRRDGHPALAKGYEERFSEPSLFFMLLNRLAAYEDAMPLELAQEIANDWGDGWPEELKAYWKTGLTPEDVTNLMAAHGTAILELSEYRKIGTKKHLLDLAKAEKDGRLVVQNAPVPGDAVWVIERDEYGEPIEISGYMFFAFVGRAAIVSSFINDFETLDETVEHHIEETLNNYGTDLEVFQKSDCYFTHEEAEAALKKREADDETD